MEVRELKTAMDRQFAWVDERFKQVEERFKQVDERFDQVIALIFSDGERTRRHFDVVAEQMTSGRNLPIDKAVAVDERAGRLTAVNAEDHVRFQARLDDHERRLADLERESGS